MKKKYSKESRIVWLTNFGNKMAKKLRMNASVPERMLYKLLKDCHFKFLFQQPFICREKYLYIGDFYFPDIKIVIELQSKKYHSTPEQKKKDSVKKRRLKKEGIQVIYLWASQISSLTKENINQLLSAFKTI